MIPYLTSCCDPYDVSCTGARVDCLRFAFCFPTPSLAREDVEADNVEVILHRETSTILSSCFDSTEPISLRYKLQFYIRSILKLHPDLKTVPSPRAAQASYLPIVHNFGTAGVDDHVYVQLIPLQSCVQAVHHFSSFAHQDVFFRLDFFLPCCLRLYYTVIAR